MDDTKTQLDASLIALNDAKLATEKLEEKQSDLLFAIDLLEDKKLTLESEVKRLTQDNEKKLSENKLISQTFISELEGRGKEKNEEFIVLDKKIAEMKSELSSLESQKLPLEKSINDLKSAEGRIKKDIEFESGELKRIKSEQEKETLNYVAKEKGLMETVDKLVNRISELTISIQSNQRTIESQDSNIKELRIINEELKKEKEKLNNEIKEKRIELDEVVQQIPIEQEKVKKLRDEGLLLVKKHLYIEAKEKQLKKFAEKAGVTI